MKKVIIFFTSMVLQLNAAPLSDELVVLHNASTAEMNAIVSPIQGSLIYNTDDSEVYECNATAWNRISGDGNETKIVAGNCIDINGTGTSLDPYVITSLTPGRTQATAGTTCKTILASGCYINDGVYWINPNGGGTEDAFEVYCDMTIDGGGWTRIEYATDLKHEAQFNDNADDRWLDNNFSLTLTDIQINDIRAASTEGKQRYHGTCEGVMHYSYNNTGNEYIYAFGFRYHEGHETAYGQQTYPSTDITVIDDNCVKDDNLLRSTDFDIIDIRVPVINVHSKDNSKNEQFGSPLTHYPAWLR